MKLIAKIVDAAVVPGGRALLLHDEQGVALPNQLIATLEQPGPGERSSVTVTFVIDGDQVRLDDGKVMVRPSHYFDVLPERSDGEDA